MDHMDYLGSNLLSIAREKFAVLRAGTTAIFTGGSPELEIEFRKVALQRGANAFLLREKCSFSKVATSLNGTDFIFWYDSGEFKLHTPLPGYFQAENAALAVCAAYQLRGGDASLGKISDDAVSRGISKTDWPGRFEIIAKAPLTILDGAHNPHAVARLSETLGDLTARGSLNIVLALMRDKDAEEVLLLFKPLEPAIYCTQVPRLERSMTAAELSGLARKAGFTPVGEYELPLDAVKASRATGRTTVCCGSLYLVGYLKGMTNELCGI